MSGLNGWVRKYGAWVHPFLFALFPLMSFYGSNASEIRSGQFNLSTFLFFNLGVMVAAWVVAFLFTRSASKSSIITVVLLFLFFNFGRVHDIVSERYSDTTGWVFGLNKTMLLLSAAVVVATWLWARRLSPESTKKVNATLSLIGFVLVATTLVSIVPAVFSGSGKSKSHEQVSNEVNSTNQNLQSKPDVYYILLDGYARADFLKQKFNYDNTPFVDELNKRGFYVADQANSNYAHTHFSVPSTFNMKYLNYLAETMGEDSIDRTPLRELTENNQVVSTFKSLGYKYVQIGSQWSWTVKSPQADIDIVAKNNADSKILNIELDEFALVYLQTTALKPWISTGIRGSLLAKILGAFERTQEVAKIEEPTLSFTHIVSPHPPYLFDAKGVIPNQTELELLNDGFSNRKGFADQTAYVNQLVIGLIDAILRTSKEPPIIILASDHGPASGLSRSDFLVTDPNKFNKSGVIERMGILNAYYFPDKNYKTLYPTISPVNSFRLVLSQYFGQDLELLPDKSYFSNNKANEYRMFDVTDLVKTQQP